jgi:predicted enzyme related to lactoylglutathione lyase
MTGPVPFWRVDDIRGSVDALVAAGGQVREDVHEVGGGRRIASVRDADGNEVGVYQDS